MIFHLSAAEWMVNLMSFLSKCVNIFVTVPVCVHACENHWVSNRTVCPRSLWIKKMIPLKRRTAWYLPTTGCSRETSEIHQPLSACIPSTNEDDTCWSRCLPLTEPFPWSATLSSPGFRHKWEVLTWVRISYSYHFILCVISWWFCFWQSLK